MGSNRNPTRPLAAQNWEATVYWSAMADELAEIPRRKVPEWLRLVVMGVIGGTFWGVLLGLGLAGVF